MSWFAKLNEAYDCGIRGQSDPKLVPVGFAEMTVKFHVILHSDGSFCTAEVFEDKHTEIVPTSPQAETRTGNVGTPYPLADQLKYIVCEEDHPNPRYDKFIAALSAWCERDDAPNCLRVLRDYLEKKTLLKDMTQTAHLKVDYGENDNYGKGKDAKSVVTFSVESESGADRLWLRDDVRNSWSNLVGQNASDFTTLCYAEGAYLPIMESHPKIQGNAKLVSAKDAGYPFVYKGRFTEDGSSAAVSYLTAAKAYNALDWLIGRQGFRRYGLTLVAWNTDGTTPPAPLSDSLFAEDDDEPDTPDTFEAYGMAVAKAAAGHRTDLRQFDAKRVGETVILGMEAATTGRMSVNYWQEIPNRTGESDDYISRLEHWYLTCCWERYDFTAKKTVVFTPSPHRIAEAVMGTQAVKTADADFRNEKSASKQMRQLLMHLLESITLRRPLPADMVKSAFERAIRPQQFRKMPENTWSESAWRETVSTACAMIRKHQCDLCPDTASPEAKLREHERDRSYLFGRLLAIADFAEFDASGRKSGTMTNAVSMMTAFVQRPCDTFSKLHDKLIPHLGKHSANDADAYQRLFSRVESLFTLEQRTSNEPLSEQFLLGYYSERQTLYRTKSVCSSEPFTWSDDRSVLYGYMAAIAEAAELGVSENSGRTNTLRYMSMLEKRPVGTWTLLHEKMIPYLEKAGKKSEVFTNRLLWCERCFEKEDRVNQTVLDGGFLHGYYTMYGALRDGYIPKPEKINAVDAADRDAVFGQLLGFENRTERFVMDIIQYIDAKHYRLSNALRYMAIFSKRPWSTWLVLKSKLLPYQRKLNDKGENLSAAIAELESILTKNGWNTDEPLTGTFLNQYYSK